MHTGSAPIWSSYFGARISITGLGFAVRLILPPCACITTPPTIAPSFSGTTSDITALVPKTTMQTRVKLPHERMYCTTQTAAALSLPHLPNEPSFRHPHCPARGRQHPICNATSATLPKRMSTPMRGIISDWLARAACLLLLVVVLAGKQGHGLHQSPRSDKWIETSPPRAAPFDWRRLGVPHVSGGWRISPIINRRLLNKKLQHRVSE